MRFYKPIYFVFQATTIGLAFAFVILMLKPDLLADGRRVAQFIESMPPDGVLPVAANDPVSYADAVTVAAPSVVNIYTRKTVQRNLGLFDDPFFRHFFGDSFSQPMQREETSLGSGVIVSPEGYVLTNNHVIEDADAIQVALRDGRNTSAILIGSDPETDLAVLRIDLDDLPAITLGQSDVLRVGDVVLAIGNPFGVGQTVTLGIVSATGRSDLGISTFENFIQTDAAINPGNSGGALITARGELIGINTAIFSDSGGSQGIGFAIPMSLAKGVMQQIVEYGRVRRGWLGVEIQELTSELAESFDLGGRKGVLIAGVFRDSPAHRAGLEPGDVIVALDGKEIEAVRDALNTIAMHHPDGALQVEVVRAGRTIMITASVDERPYRQGQ